MNKSVKILTARIKNIDVRLGRTASIIICITLISKLIGFIRESQIAANFGATALTDAYIIAVTIFTSFSLIAAEVINNAFLPIYTRLKRENILKSNIFSSKILNIIFVISVLIVLIGEIFTEIIVRLFAPGFSENIMVLSINLTKITIPVVILTGLSIIIGAILQSNERFFPQAFMGIPNHILVISFLIWFANRYGILGLTVVTAVGTASQLLVQLPFLKGTGFKYVNQRRKSIPEVKMFFSSLIPIFIGSSAKQINVMIDRGLASSTGYGNISILNYANIINISLVGLFITTLTTIIYPRIARQAHSDKEHRYTVKKSIDALLLVTIPLTIFVWIFKLQIVSFLFQRGSFSPENALETSQVLFFYSFSLIPIAIIDIISKAFYSKMDNKIPMIFGIISVIINIVLNFILVHFMGIRGLALATSIAVVVNMMLLMGKFYKGIEN